MNSITKFLIAITLPLILTFTSAVAQERCLSPEQFIEVATQEIKDNDLKAEGPIVIAGDAAETLFAKIFGRDWPKERGKLTIVVYILDDMARVFGFVDGCYIGSDTTEVENVR